MKIYRYLVIMGLVFTLNACSEDILEEVPLDFLSPENSFTKPADIEAALFNNYNRIRNFYDGKYRNTSYLHVGTDLGMGCRDPQIDNFGDYTINLLPISGIVGRYWSQLYSIVFDANVVLGRVEGIEYDDPGEKQLHIAEARFFRGYAYRCLLHLYGGVPIVLEEISSPRRDFVRATYEETLSQAIGDLEFAAGVLPSVAEVSAPGRLNNAAAWHVLAELYITARDFDKAVTAATTVINDANINLMTTRFGARAGDEGDPYWDLFQRNNQNRSAGNMEGIYVIQSEFNIPGGNDIPNGNPGLTYERNYGPLYWFLDDLSNTRIFFNASSKNGGRPVGFIRPTPYFTHTIWGNGNFDVDIRNNERNIQRDWVADNPASAFFGLKISEFPQEWRDELTAQDTLRDFFPNVTKITTKNDHPVEVLVDPATGEMSGQSGKTYTDWYLMRVAETYLLRAEAYLGLGNSASAAMDINMLRNRAGAIPVAESDVDIDYILDERMRELNWEEPRRMTLSRLNLIVERNVLGNPFSGLTVQPRNNVFPIPFSEIERNTSEVLEQNPGYTN